MKTRKLGHLQARIVALLSTGPAKVAALAEAIDKPAVNIYAAIKGLKKRGLIPVDNAVYSLVSEEKAIPYDRNVLPQLGAAQKKVLVALLGMPASKIADVGRTADLDGRVYPAVGSLRAHGLVESYGKKYGVTNEGRRVAMRASGESQAIAVAAAEIEHVEVPTRFAPTRVTDIDTGYAPRLSDLFAVGHTYLVAPVAGGFEITVRA